MLDMSKDLAKTRSRGLLFAAGFYVAAGLYLLAFALTPNMNLLILPLLGVASVLAGLGLYMLKRWAFWLAIAVFPLLATFALSTLLFSISIPSEKASLMATLLNTSLAALGALSFFAIFAVLDNRARSSKSVNES